MINYKCIIKSPIAHWLKATYTRVMMRSKEKGLSEIKWRKRFHFISNLRSFLNLSRSYTSECKWRNILIIENASHSDRIIHLSEFHCSKASRAVLKIDDWVNGISAYFMWMIKFVCFCVQMDNEWWYYNWI